MGTISEVGTTAEEASGRLTVAVPELDSHPGRARLVEYVLMGVPGVERVYVNRDTEMAYIEYRPSEVSAESLISTLDQVGLAGGDLTLRSIARGDAVPRTGGGPFASPGVEGELAPDDHACCTPAVAGGETAGVVPGVNGARTTASSHAASQPRLPFRARLGLFLTAFVLVLGPALWLIRPMESMAMRADYSVDMSMTGFTPPNFSIPAGRPVSMQFNNVDSPFHGITNGALHQFAIDDLDIDVRLDGKQSTVINLPPLTPGTYEFYCNVCCGGKVNPSMRGTLTVVGTEAMEGMSLR